MKQILAYTNNQNGFILPYVLFFYSHIVHRHHANVHSYRDEIHIAQNHTEQLKIETLLQMGRTRFKDELASGMDLPASTIYHFPYGDVDIRYTKQTKKNTIYI